MSMINKSIPEFKAEAFHNGQFKTITSSDVKGKWSIFLFYPANFTFVCPTELEDMAKHYEQFQQLDVEVYSVSTDTHFSHKAWHDSSKAIAQINYPMIGDPTGIITRGFDVMIEEEALALRGTFLINPEGIVKVAEIHDLGIGRSAKDMLRKVKAAQFVANNGGEVCPAAWEEGQATLTPGIDLVGKI